ncbi:MAG: AAA family ATPase [Acidimicrobiales bacterium]|nr:AAA family ATPase [Acidimicrobiales bacterium]HRW37790.1 AAA family ATPase [Aquihabitans sp.]
MTEGSRARGADVGCGGAARLLGTVEIEGPGGAIAVARRPQVQLVLAHLLLERRPIERGELAELLWGDGPLSPHWQGAVRGVLSKLRDRFAEADVAAELVASADGTVRLDLPEGFTVDVLEGERAVEAAEAALDAARAGDAAALATPWVERFQRPLLAAGDGDWVRDAQDHVASLARRALLATVRARLAEGHGDVAAEWAGRWVARHPLDEGVHHLLIRALVVDGRRADAVAAHDRLAAVLARELGVGPSAATSALIDEAPSPTRARPARAAGARATRPRPGTPFLGRAEELAALRRAWRATVEAEAVGVALVDGASGIGKTRLAEELAVELGDAGATVCWGRCQPGQAVPFEPVASAVHAELDPDRLAALGEDPVLVDELAAIVDGRASLDDPGLARAHRFRTIVRSVRAIAASPTVLVVDDLQWASIDVLAVLERVVEEVRSPLLLVLTGRNLPPVAHDHLARMQRAAAVTTVHLSGLAVDDLLPLASDGDDARALAAALHRRTAGHPFFVTELAGLGGGTPAGAAIELAGVPDAVREWIGHRIDALPKRQRARLDLAAVIGEELTVREVAASAGADPDEVLGELEALVEHGLLEEADRPDAFAFPHLITQEAVYARIGPSRRARLHLAVAEALAHAGEAPGRRAAVARHLSLAGDEHRVPAALALAAAGREALEQGAWELAELRFRQALERAGDHGAARAEALTGLGAALHHQGRGEEAEALLLEAVALARAQRLPVARAEAALVLVGRAGRGASRSLGDDEQAELLREALGAIEASLVDEAAADPEAGAAGADGDAHARRVRLETLACRLEGELALAILLTGDPLERARLTSSAIARAQRIEPPDTHLTARALLSARIAKLGPHQLGDRLADVDQVLALDPDGRRIETTLAALTYRHEDLLRLGRRDAARAALARASTLVAEHPHPYWRWAIAAWRALDAIIDGELDVAEERTAEALGLQGEEVGGALACYGVNLVDLRLYQGRAGEVVDLLAGAADANPHIPTYRAVLALGAAEAGDLGRAEAAYRSFAADGFALPDDPNRLLGLVVLADVAATLGDAEAAPVLVARLAPYAGQQALLNCYGGGGAFWGPVDHQLARLAALTGRRDEAAQRYASAEAAATAMASPLALARIVADPLRAVAG